MKQKTQSKIVRKLLSFKLNNTLKALIELSRIIMNLYILNHIYDEQIAKSIHRSLNKGNHIIYCEQ